jgi:L-fuculose-phosphate aldolase
VQPVELERERERVAAASRLLAASGMVVGTAGNLSQRNGDLVAITPTGAELERLTADEVAVVDLAGEQVDGALAPTSELSLHLGVYERYGAGGVVHTHPPMATALACVLEDELPVVHYQLLLLGGPVRVAPYRTFGTPELAQVTLDALEGRLAALMANHGAITWAQDVDAAVQHSLLLEWGCTVYWRAAAIGTPRALDEEQLQAVVAAALERSYGSVQQGDDER